MCGIIGFCGKGDPIPILLQGLKSLEYRGYDSAGVAVFDGKESMIEKSAGKIGILAEKLKTHPSYPPDSLLCGIGHTRWATHGAPCDVNSHPHTAASIALVHNGIIENYGDIQKMLMSKGYEFVSDTDTEVAAKLFDWHYRLSRSPLRAVFDASREMRGSFAFGIIFYDYPQTIFAIRRDSPLILAHCGDSSYIASDITAILDRTHEYVRLDEDICAVVHPDVIDYFDSTGKKINCKTEKVDWNFDEAQRGGFKHFMLKEIYESPDSIRRTVSPRIHEGFPDFGIPKLDGTYLIKRIKAGGMIHIVACGTAMHAGLIGKYLIEKYAGVRVSVEIASEFRYREPVISKNDTVILLSQSGETADTLAGLRYAKGRGIYTLAIVNVPGSTVAREADDVLYTMAGPEIAVASTKAYHVQCALLCLIAVKLGTGLKYISEDTAKGICARFEHEIPEAVRNVINSSERIRELASKIKGKEHIFYIGRGVDFQLCVEGSLKLKEISYIHSEAYAAGELKHGTISLVTDGVPVIALVTDPALYEKTLSGIREVKSRGAFVTAFISEAILSAENKRGNAVPADEILGIPAVGDSMTLFPAVTAFQLLAYHVSDLLGLDVDKPRNLAKSVTVE